MRAFSQVGHFGVRRTCNARSGRTELPRNPHQYISAGPSPRSKRVNHYGSGKRLLVSVWILGVFLALLPLGYGQESRTDDIIDRVKQKMPGWSEVMEANKDRMLALEKASAALAEAMAGFDAESLTEGGPTPEKLRELEASCSALHIAGAATVQATDEARRGFKTAMESKRVKEAERVAILKQTEPGYVLMRDWASKAVSAADSASLAVVALREQREAMEALVRFAESWDAMVESYQKVADRGAKIQARNREMFPAEEQSKPALKAVAASPQPSSTPRLEARKSDSAAAAKKRAAGAISMMVGVLMLVGWFLFLIYLPYRICRSWAFSVSRGGSPSTVRLLRKMWWRVLLLVLGVSILIAFGASSPEHAGRIVGGGIGFYLIALPVVVFACWRVSKQLRGSVPCDTASESSGLASAAVTNAQDDISTASPSSRVSSHQESQSSRTPWIIAFIAATVAVGAIAALVWFTSQNHSATPPVGGDPSVSPSRAAQTQDGGFDLVALAKQSTPAVALVDVHDANGKSVMVGTGFWISRDGKLATNLHVVSQGVKAYVRKSGAISGSDSLKDEIVALGGTEIGYEANGIVAANVEWDLAILKFDVTPTQILELGSANDIEVGERIAVIGNPQGLDGTVVEGVVSAKREASDEVPLLQMTAPISPGSSGSPVLNARGRVVGVASAYIDLKGSQGLNLAIPADIVRIALRESANASTESLSAFAAALQSAPSGKPVAKSGGFIGPKEDTDLRAVLTSQGAEAIKRQDYSAALKVADSYISYFPKDANGYALRGGAFFQQERYADAAQALEKALLFDPKSGEAWNLLGQAQARTGKWSSASASFLQACTLLPEEPMVWCGYAESLLAQRRFVEAAIALEQAAEKDRENGRQIFKRAFALRVEAKRIEMEQAGKTFPKRGTIPQQLAKNAEEVFTVLKSEGLPESAAKTIAVRGLDSYSTEWWEENVFKRLQSPLTRISLRLHLKQREELLQRRKEGQR